MRQRRIPVSEAGELAAAHADRDSRAMQLEWRPAGQGCVELVLRNAGQQLASSLNADGSRTVALLAYPQQGQKIGYPPIDEHNALKLQAATLILNRTLRDLCS